MKWENIKKTLNDKGWVRVGNNRHYIEIVQNNGGYEVTACDSFKNGNIRKNTVDIVSNLTNIKYLFN